MTKETTPITWNEVVLAGHLGKDPEVITLTDGRQLARFSLATTDSWTDKVTNEKKEATHWHNISVYNEKDIEFVSTLSKGVFVELKGRLDTYSFQDEGHERLGARVLVAGKEPGIILAPDPQQVVSKNYITLVGNVGKDPEIITPENGKAFASLAFATNDKWTDKNGQEQKKTSWHTLLLPGNQGVEFAKNHLKKGSCLEVSGRLSYDHWKDDKEKSHVKPKIIVLSKEKDRTLDFSKNKAVSLEM